MKLRKNIIESARAMNQSDVSFEVFSNARCNPRYWTLTNQGGFQQRFDVLPADAIRDIFRNSSLYAFECATAMIIIYYFAVLNTIGDYLFNQLFQNLYLYSWHADPDLGIRAVNTTYFLPGDIVYFNNPDFNPETPWWRGENAVDLGDGTYFGHGIGIMTAPQIIHELNQLRRPGSTTPAVMDDLVVRPSAAHFATLLSLSQYRSTDKIKPIVIHHDKESIRCDQYQFYLYSAYNDLSYLYPFA